MAFSAYQRVTAAALNRIQPRPVSATGTSITLSTTITDIPGAVINVVTTAPNALWTADAFFDSWIETVSGGVTQQGQLWLNGVLQPIDSIFSGNASGLRATPGMNWNGTLATAGAHQFKLRGKRDIGAGGSYKFPSSRLTVVIYEVP